MKILMIGLGGAGQRHLRNFREILGPGSTFIAWRARGREGTIAPDFSRVLTDSLGVTSHPTLESALEQRPDLAVISNPTNLHLPAALASARAGVHVLVEKPLSHSFDGVRDLGRAISEGRLVGLVGYMMRFHPCLQQIHEWIREERLGKILSARFEVASYVPEWHPYEDFRDLYAVKREMGGGVILTESHELDLAYWFFGLPRRVFAVGGALSGQSGDVEDTASITLDYGFPVQVQLCFMQRPPSRSCEINGTRGRVVWEGGSSVRRHEGQWASLSFEGHERAQLFRDEARHVLACIEGRETPRVSVEDGAASLRMALAALESLKSGNAVEVT